ncbi:hypothetical protein ACHAWX_001007 [Stephanocyclus meneghinianus]
MESSKTICLFGATGFVGSEFLRMAVDQGYSVRCLVRSPSKIPKELADNERVTLTEGDFTGPEEDVLPLLEKVLPGADYVVCIAGMPPGMGNKYPKDVMLRFVQNLYKVMTSKAKPRVFLFQSGGASPHPRGYNKIRTGIAQLAVRAAGYYPNVCDNTNIQKFILEQKDGDGKPSVNFIVTRPLIITPSEKVARDDVELEGKEDGFSFSEVKNTELARFTLKSLEDESLYGKMPFILPGKK